MGGFGSITYGKVKYAGSSSSLANVSKLFIEQIILVDNLSKNIAKTIKDTISLIDIYSNIKKIYSLFIDSITLVDNFPRVFRKLLVDSIVLADLGYKNIKKSFSDTLSLADNLLEKISKQWTEIIVVTDSLVHSFKVSFQDAITLADDFFGYITGILFKEIISLSEEYNIGIKKTIKDVLNVVDYIRRNLNGFFLHWTKRDNEDQPTYIKDAIPAIEYEKQTFETSIWTKKDSPVTPTYTKTPPPTTIWTKKNRPNDLE